LFGDAGYLIFDPAWKPITWKESDLEKGIIWIGASLPGEFFRYGTPVDEEPAAPAVAAE
jgi:catechol 2,3-dioxygenase